VIYPMNNHIFEFDKQGNEEARTNLLKHFGVEA